MRDTLESHDRNTRAKKRGERFQNHPHPLAIIRKEYGYTQQEVAKHLGMTRQVIVDNEQGLSMHPNPKYVAYLAAYEPTARKLISDACYAWRAQRRADLDDPQGTTILVEALQTSAEPPTSLSALITHLPTRQDAHDALKVTDYANQGYNGSIRGFARLIIVQTSIIKSYLNSGHHWDQIRIALEECGLSPAMIAFLHQLPRTEEQAELLKINKAAESR